MTEQKYPDTIVEAVQLALKAVPRRRHGEGSDEYRRRKAVAALDALGLTVGERWGFRPPTFVNPVQALGRDDAEASAEGAPLVRRTVLHAETPWVEVTDDAE